MNNQDVKIKKAFELFNNKKFEESKLIFLDLIKNQQFDKRAYYMLYEIYLQLNDNKNAKKYLISFLEFDNKNYVALNQLANLYLKEGTIKLAEENYIKAINLKKDYLIAITNLAVLYQGIGDKDNAEKYYLEGINLSPYDLSIYYNLSRVSPNLINDKNTTDNNIEKMFNNMNNDDSDDELNNHSTRNVSEGTHIIDLLLNNNFNREEKINEFTTILNNCGLPKVKGDEVTFIGSTFIRNGESKPYLNHCIVINGCNTPKETPNCVIETYDTEKKVLCAWTKIIQKENPDIIIG